VKIEKLLSAAFDFGSHISSTSIANQVKGSGQDRQEKYEEMLDAILDIRSRLAKIRRGNPLCYEILRLRYGLDREIRGISHELVVSVEDIQELIDLSLLYVSEVSDQIPEITQKYTQPIRSDLAPGTPLVILSGALEGIAGDFIQFEGILQDRVIIRYFINNIEQIAIQNIFDIDWH
jgi:hypothetical protein